MKTLLGLWALLVVAILPLSAQSISNREEAMEIARKAVKIMDEGNYAESIQLLEQSKEIDSTFYLYDYEIALAHLLQEDHQASIEILEAAIAHYDTLSSDLFQLLGNAYDLAGNPNKALEVYEAGLDLFPSTGRLYYEMGVVYGSSLEDINKAIESWEKGIEVEPNYPSNYFYLAKVYCDSEDELWGMLYGEIFMNLEKNTARTAEMSQILFETYRKGIKIKSKKEAIISFTQNNSISLGPEGELTFPFGMQYEMFMTIAATTSMMQSRKKIKNIEIAHLHSLRLHFISVWYENEKHNEYPNALFDWHQKLIEEDLFETYNHWLFMKGNETAASNWFDEHEKELGDFTEWFLANPIPLTTENCFVRTKY